MTDKEKEKYLAEIAQAKYEASMYTNMEQGVKLLLNSIYGAFGNAYFYFFNVDIAETITLQGKDAILYTEEFLNKYFKEYWHKDTAVHKELGITVTGKIENPVGIYIDTDSTYVKFDEVLKKSEGWNGDEKEFILKLYEVRLKDYIEKILQKYADDNNAENFLSFELESIAKNAIWLAKKKYMQNIVWKDPDIHYDDLSKISAKGFEIIQSSTPAFARNKLKELLTYIFSVDELNIKEFASLLKNIKREFRLANVDQISFSKKVNNYQKYIINDYKSFEIGSKCPIGVRSAGYHNYLLNNSDLKRKYQPLGNGEKLKMYFSTDKICDVFAYSPGDHPYEFAPPIDYDKQFEKTILDPINRVIVAMGFKEFNRNLIYATSVF
jgi:DNA polymerase elongation subunit (family B)